MAENHRRTPTQARAQVTREAIVEATAQLLVEEGYARATTNRIAERAGVSIGSLYHYFARREDIVAAVVERLAERQIARTGELLQGVGGPDPVATVRALVRAAVTAQRVDADLSHVLLTQVPRENVEGLDRRWKQRLTELVAASLVASDVRPQRAELAAWVLVRAVFGVVRDAIAERPELLRGDALVDEVSELVAAYLAS